MLPATTAKLKKTFRSGASRGRGTKTPPGVRGKSFRLRDTINLISPKQQICALIKIHNEKFNLLISNCIVAYQENSILDRNQPKQKWIFISRNRIGDVIGEIKCLRHRRSNRHKNALVAFSGINDVALPDKNYDGSLLSRY